MIMEIEVEGLNHSEKLHPVAQSLCSEEQAEDFAHTTQRVCANAILDSNGAPMGPPSPGAAVSTVSLCSQDSEQSSLVHVASSDTSEDHMDAGSDLFCEEGSAVESACRKMRLWNRVEDE